MPKSQRKHLFSVLERFCSVCLLLVLLSFSSMFSTRINWKIQKLEIFGFPFFPDSSCVYFHFSRNFVRLCGFQNLSRPPLPFPGALWRHPQPFGAAAQPQWISGLISHREVLEWGTRLGALQLWVPDVLERFSSNLLFTSCSSAILPNSKVSTQSKKQMQLLLSYISHDTTLNLLIILERKQVIRQINYQLVLHPNEWNKREGMKKVDFDHIPQNRLGSVWN